MSGVEVYRTLRKIDPDVPVVITSGYSEETIRSQLRGRPPEGFVQKPFTVEALEESIGVLVDEDTAEPP